MDKNEPQTLDNEGTPGLGKEWTVFESKGSRGHVNIVKTNLVEGYYIDEKEKNRAERKRASKNQMDQKQLMQQLEMPVTLKEYMSGEWFKMTEEEEEEVIYSRRMIIVYINLH